MYVGRVCANSGEPIARGVSDRVVAQAVRSIARRLDDFDAGRFMESMQRVRIVNHEINRTALRGRSAVFEEQLNGTEVQAGKGRWIAFGERQPETELLRVELDRRADLADGENRMVF